MPGPDLASRGGSPIATPANDGFMSAAQAAKLAGLTPAGNTQAFQYTIQAGDNDDFFVSIPVAMSDGNYMVTPVIASGSSFTNFIIPFSSQTTAQFEVLSDGTLPIGTLINFTVQEL